MRRAAPEYWWRLGENLQDLGTRGECERHEVESGLALPTSEGWEDFHDRFRKPLQTAAHFGT